MSYLKSKFGSGASGGSSTPGSVSSSSNPLLNPGDYTVAGNAYPTGQGPRLVYQGSQSGFATSKPIDISKGATFEWTTLKPQGQTYNGNVVADGYEMALVDAADSTVPTSTGSNFANQLAVLFVTYNTQAASASNNVAAATTNLASSIPASTIFAGRNDTGLTNTHRWKVQLTPTATAHNYLCTVTADSGYKLVDAATVVLPDSVYLRFRAFTGGASDDILITDVAAVLPLAVSGGADATATHYKGAWDSTKTYAANDVVTRSYGLYAALTASTNVDPAAPVGAPVATSIIQNTTRVANSPTFAAATTAGNSVLLVVMGYGGTFVTPNNYSVLYDSGADANTSGRIVYYLSNSQASVTSIPTAFTGADVYAFELQGVVSLAGSGRTGSTNASSSSVTASAASGSALALVAAQDGNNGTINTPAGWTQRAYFAAAGKEAIFSLDNASSPVAVTVTDGNTYVFLAEVLLQRTATAAWTKLANVREASVLVKTAAYTMVDPDTLVLANGTFTVTLPVASVANTGKRYTVKNTGTGTVTIAPQGAATIDGVASVTLAVQYSSEDYANDGTNWFTV